MNSDAAQKLTIKLANRLQLPETEGVAGVPTTPTAAPLGPTQAVPQSGPAQASVPNQSSAPQASEPGKKS